VVRHNLWQQRLFYPTSIIGCNLYTIVLTVNRHYVCSPSPDSGVLSLRCTPADIEEVDAVISTIGGSTKDPSADSTGNINVIEAAAAKGVKKFILVTSIGCGDSRDAPGEQVYKVLEPVLVQKDKAEERLKVWGRG
jgi:hypothetical protein